MWQDQRIEHINNVYYENQVLSTTDASAQSSANGSRLSYYGVVVLRLDGRIRENMRGNIPNQ